MVDTDESLKCGSWVLSSMNLRQRKFTHAIHRFTVDSNYDKNIKKKKMKDPKHPNVINTCSDKINTYTNKITTCTEVT